MDSKIKSNIKEVREKTKVKIKQSIEKYPKLTSTGKKIIKIIGLSSILFSLVILIYDLLINDNLIIAIDKPYLQTNTIF